MSQRTEKVESLVQRLVASELRQGLATNAERVTVTRVDAAPDLKTANVWIGIIADSVDQQKAVFEQVLVLRGQAQRAVAKTLTTKFVPKLFFKLDEGGQYAEYIDRLLKGL